MRWVVDEKLMQVDHTMTWVARSLDLDSVIVNVDQNDPFDVARITSCCICAVSCKCVLLHLLMLFKDHELLKNQQHAASLRHEPVKRTTYLIQYYLAR